MPCDNRHKAKGKRVAYLLSSGLYRRYRNFTGSALARVLADCHRRWGITPRLEDYIIIITKICGLSIESGQIVIVSNRHLVATFVFGVSLMALYPDELYLMFIQKRQ